MKPDSMPVPLANEISVNNCGHENCAPLYRYGPAVRDHTLLHVVQSGSGVLENEYGRFPVSAGQGFFIFPEEVTVYTADQFNPWVYAWVGFSGSLAKHLTDMIAVSRQNPVLSFGEYADTITAIVRDIYHDTSALYLRETAAASGVLRLFAWIRQSQLKDSRSLSVTVSQRYFQKAQWYMEANLQNNLKITDVASFVGLSRSQLFRIIVAGAGIPPKRMLLMMRLKRAESLLRETELPLKAVAFSSGFSSAAHMGNVFRAEKGMTATQYRNR